MFKIYCLIWASLSIFSLFAQTKYAIEGYIRTTDNFEALAGVTIILKGTVKGTVSTLNGYYKLRFEQAGTYILAYSYLGYKTVTQTIDVNGLERLDLRLETDTINYQPVIIYSPKSYPITQTQINKAELSKQNLGQDLPYLLNYSPSIVSTSDAGAGIGYTGIRIRGSDAQRTNVTVNGIPLNDSESQGVFWVNMPDLASSVQNITIQRGVGTSVNGAGAFGASININTVNDNILPSIEMNSSYGSFNTVKANLIFNTGQINQKFNFNGRLSRLYSDGYIDNAFTDLRSYYLSGNYKSRLGRFTFNVLSGQEQTFQAWNGVLKDSILVGNRTYNELAKYDNETDNYQQDHYQLLYNKRTGDWTIHTALHYTRGRGYFEQLKENGNLKTHNIDTIFVSNDTITRSDLIRQRWLDNHFWGGLFSATYQTEELQFTFGAGANRYLGDHFGEVVWSRFAGNTNIRHRYYANHASKNDFNAYTKLSYNLFGSLWGLLDLQVRHLTYSFLGFNTDASRGQKQVDLTFFNPKLGFKYYLPKGEIYLFYAVANHEPNRDDYTESSSKSRPDPEKLHNLELGYKGQTKNWQYSINSYLMLYRDQLLAIGNVNDVGEFTRVNVDLSYRAGLELQSLLRLNPQFNWLLNATFSENRIDNYLEKIDDSDNEGVVERNHKNTKIAFSPQIIAASQFRYMPTKNLEITLLSKYVDRQFLDNTTNIDRSIEAYLVNDLRFIYTLTSKKFFKTMRISLLVNNILDNLYESNGYTYGYISGGEQRFNYLYPQAGRNFLVGLTVGN